MLSPVDRIRANKLVGEMGANAVIGGQGGNCEESTKLDVRVGFMDDSGVGAIIQRSSMLTWRMCVDLGITSAPCMYNLLSRVFYL